MTGARSKPPMAPAKNTPRLRHEFCHHIDSNGERCYAATENGRHSCPACLERERPLPATRYNVIKSYL